MEIDMVAVPKEIHSLHNNIVLGIDYMFVNGLAFFITVSSKIKFGTVEYVQSMTTKMTLKYLQTVIQLYNSHGFRIHMVMGDEQFDPLEPILQEKHNIKYNSQSANEHVGEIECHIHTIKE